MKSASANRPVDIRLYAKDGGNKPVKIVKGQINFSTDLEDVMKQMASVARLSPTDPIYSPQQLFIVDADGKSNELKDDKELEELCEALNMFHNSIKSNSKIVAKLHVIIQDDSAALRPRSIKKTPSRKTPVVSRLSARSTDPADHDENNKFANVMVSAVSGAKRPLSKNYGSAIKAQQPSAPQPQEPAAAQQEEQARAVSVSESPAPVQHEQPLCPEPIMALTQQPSQQPEAENVAAAAAQKAKLQQREKEMIQSVKKRIDRTWHDCEPGTNDGQPATEIEDADDAIDRLIPSGKNQECNSDDEDEDRLDTFQYYSPEEFADDLPGMDDEDNTAAPAGLSAEEALKLLTEHSPLPAGKQMDSQTQRTPDATNFQSPERAKRAIDRSSKSSRRASQAPLAATASSKKKSVQAATSGMDPTAEVLERWKKELHPVDKSIPTSTKSSAKKKSSSLMRHGDGDHSPFSSPMRLQRDGRPSIGTMQRQWEFMCTQFVSNNPEELEWLMASKRAGGCRYARRKNEEAEDTYFRSLTKIDRLSTTVSQLQEGHTARLVGIINSVAAQALILTTNPLHPQAKQLALDKIAEAQQLLGAENGKEIIAVFKVATQNSINDIFNYKAAPSTSKETIMYRQVRKMDGLKELVAQEIKLHKTQLAAAQKASETALENMEKWSRRERESDDYNDVLREEEVQWLEAQTEKNRAALESMRSYIPVNISELSVKDLMDAAKEKGGLLSLELANEIKNNKLLQWTVMHTEDIAMANFLSGDKKTYFDNIESLDIVELRAIASVLPAKFELDNEGRKAEWRARFMARAKQIVAQSEGGTVKGPYDEKLGKRIMVPLPQLKPEQLRRTIYNYRTKEQSAQKLKQYDDKLQLLEKKRKALVEAETAEKEALEEYRLVLDEYRDPDLIEQHGEDKLKEALQLAKQQKETAIRAKADLKKSVAQVQRTVDSMPVTREQFVESEKELSEYLRANHTPGICCAGYGDESEPGDSENAVFDWWLPGQPAVLINGVFDRTPEIQKQQRATAKFLSAEEEAALRKAELSQLTAKKEPETIDWGVASEALEESEAEVMPSVSNDNDEDVEFSRRPISMRCTMFMGKAATEGDDSAPLPPRTPSKRNSVLASTNPELLNSLNKMLSNSSGKFNATAPLPSAPANGNRKSVRRASMLASLSSKSKENEGGAEGKPKEPKKVRSKLLARLLGDGGSTSKRNSIAIGQGAASRPQLSFLDQIKSKKLGLADDSTKSEPTAPANAVPFLSQLKAASKKFQSIEEGAEEDEDESPSAARDGALAPKAAPQMSLFDAIKARRKD